MRTTGLNCCRYILTASMVLVAILGSEVLAQDDTSARTDRMKVHEWGTFTVLQDEGGRQLPGVNVDDEPVPEFVHNIPEAMILPTVLDSRQWFYRMKGVPRRHPQVTVRLETPVIYFYPPADQTTPIEVDVRAKFRGGWLTEFYPDAKFDVNGVSHENFNFAHLNSDTRGSLSWKSLQVGAADDFPETDEHVWLAPRQVQATPITAANGESEKYVFYRGVGNFGAPLRVSMDRTSGNAELESQLPNDLALANPWVIPDLWIVHITDDGKVAFRTLNDVGFDDQGEANIDTLSYRFAEEEFSESNMDKLQQEMHACLVEEGLFADEAAAMLATWKRAYFQSPGLRVFFPTPREWTDRQLELELSVDADIERVMMCRIELITDEQRASLSTLAMGPASDSGWLNDVKSEEMQDKLLAGRTVEDLGDLEVPDDFKLYMQLGRFRNALLVAEEKRTRSESIAEFIDNYRLQAFQPPRK